MILLDSSVLVAAVSAHDANHARAQAILAEVDRGVWGRALIPDYVLVEVANTVMRRVGFEAASRFVRGTADSPTSFIVPCFESLRRGLEIFLGQKEKALSLADAAIVAVAERERVRNLATFDSGFRAFPALNIISAPRSDA